MVGSFELSGQDAGDDGDDVFCDLSRQSAKTLFNCWLPPSRRDDLWPEASRSAENCPCLQGTFGPAQMHLLARFVGGSKATATVRRRRRCFPIIPRKKEGKGEVVGVEGSSLCGVAVRRTVAIIHRSLARPFACPLRRSTRRRPTFES